MLKMVEVVLVVNKFFFLIKFMSVLSVFELLMMSLLELMVESDSKVVVEFFLVLVVFCFKDFVSSGIMSGFLVIIVLFFLMIESLNSVVMSFFWSLSFKLMMESGVSNCVIELWSLEMKKVWMFVNFLVCLWSFFVVCVWFVIDEGEEICWSSEFILLVKSLVIMFFDDFGCLNLLISYYCVIKLFIKSFGVKDKWESIWLFLGYVCWCFSYFWMNFFL